MNINYIPIENSTGIVALIDVNTPTTIGIRSDMDALPIE